jgi:hypothetical protein
MSNNRFDTCGSSESLADSLTTVGRSHDDTSDILEVCGVIDDSCVCLLMTIENVYPGKGVNVGNIEFVLD